MSASNLLTLTIALFALATGPLVSAAGTPATPAAVPGKARSQPPVPLIDAVHAGRMERVKQLLKDNADVNVARLNGFTALHMAARTGNEAIARVLIQAGADVNAATMGNRVTPLYVAARTGHLSVARLLLSAGATVTQPVMAVAVADGRKRMVGMFLQHGADIERRDANGDTYLHLAVLSGRIDMVNLLISHGARVDVKDGNGLTPLSLAAGDDAVTAALRAGGAEDTPPPDWKTLITTGDMAAARGDDRSAQAKYQLALAGLAPRPADEALPWRLMVLQKLARAYQRTDQPDKARRAADDFIKDYRQDSGISRLALARVATLRGRIELQRGRFSQAQGDFQTAVDVYEAQSPADPAALTGAYLRLANTLIRQDRYGQAQAVFEKARRVLLQDKEADPVVLAMTEQSLAHALRFQGRLDEAQAMYKHSNALFAKAPDADRGMAASGLYGLADIARRRGRLAEAVALYKKAINAFEKTDGLSPAALKRVKREYRRLRKKLAGAGTR